MSVQRHKTEMVGTLVLPVECLAKQAAADEEFPAPLSPSMTKDLWLHTTAEAVQHLGQEMHQSVVKLQTRKTEMYGTLIIIDTLVGDQPPTTSSPSASPPSSPTAEARKGRGWNDPMDQVSL